MARMVELEGGITMRSYPTAPAGFDPLTATDRELKVYGYPRRPLEGRTREFWDEFFSQHRTLIEPELKLRPNARNRYRPAGARFHPNHSGNNWAGSIVHAAEGEPFNWVMGTWKLPFMEDLAHDAGPDEIYTVSAWIGIDGDGSQDVLQVGSEAVVWGNPDPAHQPQEEDPDDNWLWFEWYPLPCYSFTSFPQDREWWGTLVTALICVESPTSAMIFITLKEYRDYTYRAHIIAPTGVGAEGNSAEWIVEVLHPTPLILAEWVGDRTEAIGAFGDVTFTRAVAGNADPRGPVLGAGTGELVTIDRSARSVLPALEVVATAVVEGPESIRVHCDLPSL